MFTFLFMNALFFVFISLFSIEVSAVNPQCFHNDFFEIRLKSGSSFFHECRCTNFTSTARIRWLDKNDKEITSLRPDSRVYTEEDHYGRSLFIPSVTKATSGKYKCVADDGTEPAEGNEANENVITFDVVAYEPLYFFNAKEHQYIVKNSNSFVHCEAKGNWFPEVTWHKENIELSELYRRDKYEFKPEGLLIKDVTEEDSGIYKCSAAVLKTGEVIERSINVDVLTRPWIESIRAFPNRTIVAGETVRLECVADGIPRPKFSWNRITDKADNRSLLGNSSWVQNVNTLSKLNLTADDRGTYECIAYNEAGLVKKEITIEVWVPPRITDFRNITVAEGSTAQIVCKAYSRPRPKILITTDNPGLENDTRIIWVAKNVNDTRQDFYLSFTPVDRYHAGFYYCSATNEVSTESETMYMTVLHKAYFKSQHELIWGWKGKHMNLSCDNDSNPPATITWRFHGKDIPAEDEVEINKLLKERQSSGNSHYLPLVIVNDAIFGDYECTATNDLGSETKVITLKEASAPPAIVNASIINGGATSVRFTITARKESKSVAPPVIGFIVEYDTAENYNVTDIHHNRTWALDRPFKIDHLKPYTTYRVRFAAINAVGAGPWSVPMEFKTSRRSVPDSPVWDQLSLDTVGDFSKNNKIILKWTKPESNGSPIDYYSLKYCTAIFMDSPLCKEFRIAANQIELTDLYPNTTYRLELVAHNSEGDSAVSKAFITTPDDMDDLNELRSVLSAGAIIAVSVITVFICLLILDVLLLVWRRKGIIASCCGKKKRKEETLTARDRKVLLTENSDPLDDHLKRTNQIKDYEYKPSGVITGKHSAV